APLRASETISPLHRAAAAALHTLDESVALVRGEIPARPEPRPRHLLHAPLLRVAGLPLGTDWAPDQPALVEDPTTGELRRPLLTCLLEYAAAEAADWEAAFEAQCEAEDHEATARILELLEAPAPTPQ